MGNLVGKPDPNTFTLDGFFGRLGGSPVVKFKDGWKGKKITIGSSGPGMKGTLDLDPKGNLIIKTSRAKDGVWTKFPGGCDRVFDLPDDDMSLNNTRKAFNALYLKGVICLGRPVGLAGRKSHARCDLGPGVDRAGELARDLCRGLRDAGGDLIARPAPAGAYEKGSGEGESEVDRTEESVDGVDMTEEGESEVDRTEEGESEVDMTEESVDEPASDADVDQRNTIKAAGVARSIESYTSTHADYRIGVL